MQAVAAGALAAGAPAWAREPGGKAPRRPIIDITDLYHPAQDPGDNVDLLSADALPEVDLRAVVLDVSGRYRRPYINPEDPGYDDPRGGRDPGFIPVIQLNALFDRTVPCAAAPYEPMAHPEDKMEDAPAFQQAGIDLILDTLRAADQPVDILSFGSARPLAVAWNRAPGLLREKVRRVHLCAGSAPAGYVEWNVKLDPHAFVRVLRSDLPVALYPCSTERSPVEVGPYNCFWRLPDLAFIRDMTPALRRYLVYAFEAESRVDFLLALEEDPSEEALDRFCGRPHNVWETAVWLEVSGRRLVRRGDGSARIVAADGVAPDDRPVSGELAPCSWTVKDNGDIRFDTDNPSGHSWIYRRKDPEDNQRALQEALPELYRSYVPAG